MTHLFYLFFLTLVLNANIAIATDDHHDHGDKVEPHTSDEGKGHDDHDHDEHEEESDTVGPGKAILAADPVRGIQLSPKTVKRLGIQTIPAAGPIITAPREILVYYQNAVGLYRLRDGWFKLINVQPPPARDSYLKVTSSELKPGDQIVTTGSALVRIAELDAFGGIEAGHGH